MLTSHPADARYFPSRAQAKAARKPGERIVRLGSFAGGSFGCYPKQLSNGRYVGQASGPGGLGPIPGVTVWMVTATKGE